MYESTKISFIASILFMYSNDTRLEDSNQRYMAR